MTRPILLPMVKESVTKILNKEKHIYIYMYVYILGMINLVIYGI